MIVFILKKVKFKEFLFSSCHESIQFLNHEEIICKKSIW